MTGSRAVHEVADPGDHPARGLAEAGVAVRVPLDVEDTGQGAAVAGPAAAVVDEVVGLGCSIGGVRGREVVRPADHAHVVGAVVLLGEVGVGVVRPLGGLHIGPLDPAGPQGRPGDVALVAGDVDALRLGGQGAGGDAVGAVVCRDAHAHVGGAARRGAAVPRGRRLGGQDEQGQGECEGEQESGRTEAVGVALFGSVHGHSVPPKAR